MRELTLYEFQLDHSSTRATKNICYAELTKDHHKVSKRLTKRNSGHMNVDDEAWSRGHKKAIPLLYATEAKSVIMLLGSIRPA